MRKQTSFKRINDSGSFLTCHLIGCLGNFKGNVYDSKALGNTMGQVRTCECIL